MRDCLSLLRTRYAAHPQPGHRGRRRALPAASRICRAETYRTARWSPPTAARSG